MLQKYPFQQGLIVIYKMNTFRCKILMKYA